MWTNPFQQHLNLAAGKNGDYQIRECEWQWQLNVHDVVLMSQRILFEADDQHFQNFIAHVIRIVTKSNGKRVLSPLVLDYLFFIESTQFQSWRQSHVNCPNQISGKSPACPKLVVFTFWDRVFPTVIWVWTFNFKCIWPMARNGATFYMGPLLVSSRSKMIIKSTLYL